MKIDIVIGLGYGDEGKGRVVDHLSTSDSTVIRFNGGHQAGHTVHGEKHKHVFSSIGSGALKEADTYISRFCTFYPPGFMNELHALQTAGYDPAVYVDSEAMVTIPYDIEFNKMTEGNMGKRAHGSVGVGFGKTLERNEKHFKIFVRDLKYPNILREKLRIAEELYYPLLKVTDEEMEDFMSACAACVSNIYITDERKFFAGRTGHLIFEGAQGVMLDMDYGFFPHVTRSHTTSRNAVELISKYYPVEDVSMHYVTRAYTTRHGNGPFNYTPITLKNNELETNVPNEWQGSLRVGELSLPDLQYAVDCDRRHSSGISTCDNLYMTCLDQRTEDLIPSPLVISKYLNMDEVYASFSPGPDPIIKIKR